MVACTLRLCFWPIEALWMVGLWLAARGERAGQVLHWLPIYYDEFIVLPLPLLGRFLAQAYRYNQAGARQAIDYLTTHSRQQAAARQAQVLIALDQLARCDTTRAIATVSDQLRWISQPPPPELGPTLPALLDVSQGVRAALRFTTRYRQQVGLERQISQLRTLRESLVTGNPMFTSRYGYAIDRWHDVLAAAIRILQQEGTREDEIPPVYLAGPHLRPEEADRLFKGRDDIFTEIEVLLLAPQPPILLLHGQRRTGKTSLIAYLPQRLPADLVPVRVNVHRAAAAATNTGLAYQIAQDIVDSARRGRNLILPSPALADFQADPFVVLGVWLRQAEQTARGRSFLLCLDEFQRLEEVIAATGSRAVLNFLRDLLEHRRRWTLLLAGSHLEEKAPYWSDYLINSRRLHISYLRPEEARELIEHPIPDFEQHMRYEAEAVEAILQLTHAQPFLVQLLCAELVNRLNVAQRRTATEADVQAVLDDALEHGGEYFDEIWNSASLAERGVLCQIAVGKLESANAAVLDSLCRRELLEPTDDGYRFQVPLIQRWVQKKAQSSARMAEF
ncbi:MAG: ATP-binding protein [Anaerolineales bacterium]|nr:MAG: ATP-binding protein [Anaerolineales bacterium]